MDKKENETLKKVKLILIGVSIIPIIFVGSACISAFIDVTTEEETPQIQEVKQEAPQETPKEEPKEEEVKQEAPKEGQKEELKEGLSRELSKVDLDISRRVLEFAFSDNPIYKNPILEIREPNKVILKLDLVSSRISDGIKETKNFYEEPRAKELYKEGAINISPMIIGLEGEIFKNSDDFLNKCEFVLIVNDEKGKKIFELDNKILE